MGDVKLFGSLAAILISIVVAALILGGTIQDGNQRASEERAAIRTEIADLREEIAEEIADVREEIGDVREEIGDVREDLAHLAERVAFIEGRLSLVADAVGVGQETTRPMDNDPGDSGKRPGR